MIRLIFLLLVITALSLGLAWIADEPGHVAIDWSNYHIETSLLVVICAIALTALACVIAYVLLYLLLRSPRMWMRSRLAKRQALGLEALTQAFAAIATQDVNTARKQIVRAQQYLPNQPLTLMLSAQAARLEGNESQARLYLEQMLNAEGTEFMAARGLVENARKIGDDAMALEYAEKALALKPDDDWLIGTLVGLYSKQGRTQNALKLLESSARKRYISKQELREYSAYVLYENARTLSEQNRWDFAIVVLEDIMKKLPGFSPAAALLAQAHLKQNEPKRALKVISNAWKAAPHPCLSEMLLKCYDICKDKRKVVFTAEKLAQVHPEDRESQFLMAGMALSRHDFTSARGYLRHLAEDKETFRVCSMMANLEHAEDNPENAADWLRRATHAGADPAYICSNCAQPSDTWHLNCPHCATTASLSWR